MDFFQISTREAKGKDSREKGVLEIYPDFVVGRSKDLMVRAKSFYAVWAEDQGLWSTDEYDVQRLVDMAMDDYAEKLRAKGVECTVKYLRSFTTNQWKQFRTFLNNVSDNSHQLDQNLTFANSTVKKTDYVSRRLPYPLTSGDHSAWDELIGTLYAPEERAKIEWAIGAIVSGDAKKIQKFMVFYGPAGTGKSTVLNIIEKLFEGYTTTFEAKALVGNNNSFATEVFKTNPLVAIQHDGDLSRIEDNTKLNSIVSHEFMTINEKYKPGYTARINAFLYMGTNKPVKITDAKSGLIRRLIDVHPTGKKFDPNHYYTLMSQIDFELGAIAQHCLEVYQNMGKNAYQHYQPLEMMLQTNVFYNFIEAHWDVFDKEPGISLRQAYALYKEYCADTGVDLVLPQHKFRDEMKNYFSEFQARTMVDGVEVRSYYSGFSALPFKAPVKPNAKIFSLVMDETKSIFDEIFAEVPAQYAKADGTPERRWASVQSTLGELDTTREHFVKVPETHIVIDFDLRGDDGSKSLERNLEAASSWPATYAEISRGGAGVHLHYEYDGPVGELASVYDDGIEVKVFTGGSSLRRRLSKCNNVPVATLNSGLPFKEKKVLQATTIKGERGLREQIARNLRKEIHPGTKPSIDFIKKILDDAYASGLPYDVRDLKPKILVFALGSTNQQDTCVKLVKQMQFQGQFQDLDSPPFDPPYSTEPIHDTSMDDLVCFDLEVYPNLFVICWRTEHGTTVKMINPTPKEIEGLFKLKLIGFNNRRYDNHILYAAFLGYTNEQLYKLSKKIIDGDSTGFFGEAYNLSYADIYEFASVKMSLKKWEIALGIHHMELDLPWDEPVPPELWGKVVDYCCNDLDATWAVFKARKGDWDARLILSSLSGLPVNSTTQQHAAKIIFKGDRNPQASFVYTNLSKEFPGYVYDRGKSTYRGETVGEGGYVYAEPGMYKDVALLDIASMHPTSIYQLNAFGEYTPNFWALVEARLAIKRGDFDSAREMFGGKLAPYLEEEAGAKALSDALKIVINIVYGLTSAKFDNPFRDPRNKDNIVAKRGALFMIDLKHAVQEQGFTVAHIKTDSIKIPEATAEIIDFVKKFGEKYGYTFEYKPSEDHYDQMCLVNDAVYIARIDECIDPIWIAHDDNAEQDVSNEGFDQLKQVHWKAVGAQFQHPYVFKSLFTGDDLEFADFCEAKAVTKGAIYIDFEAGKPMHKADTTNDMHFVGRTGLFVPVKEGYGGGVLYRWANDKAYALSGTKGYLWLEAEVAKDLPMEAIDMTYFERLAQEAENTIDYYGPYAEFVR